MPARLTVTAPEDAAAVNGAEPNVTLVSLRGALDQGPVQWDRVLQSLPEAWHCATWAWHGAGANAAPGEDLVASDGVMLRGGGGSLKAVLPVGVPPATFRRRPAAVLTWAIGDVGCP